MQLVHAEMHVVKSMYDIYICQLCIYIFRMEMMHHDVKRIWEGFLDDFCG